MNPGFRATAARMAPARIWTAADVNGKIAETVEVERARGKFAAHGFGESARKTNAQTASRSSGARDEIPQHRRFGIGQTNRGELLMNHRQFPLFLRD